ncbi:hypothetical protein [Aquisphaera insulae]|uniref:hypothetical protein n=1 Tax=Aquisphaera insulae TaxID=2712864 RepID=UPI0013EC5FCA|nr:hypothetical protein [Aquisphaera insulae]
MNEVQSPRHDPPRLQLLDLAAIVVGYGLAAVLFRAFAPRGRVSPHVVAFASGFYLWLGVAMSGPFVLARRRDPGLNPTTPRRTWAENAWLAIGVYWIVLGAVVIPGRLDAFRFGDTILFGVVPVMASLGFWAFGTRRAGGPATAAAWTHRTALALMATWPFAWFCLIVVGQAIL